MSPLNILGIYHSNFIIPSSMSSRKASELFNEVSCRYYDLIAFETREKYLQKKSAEARRLILQYIEDKTRYVGYNSSLFPYK